mmetsp:Transcript_168/g.558  ORF Transcript_168/g.558 Transcript_168/m.558 type:complete len:319 (+) Transcript_168:71-1027(+)
MRRKAAMAEVKTSRYARRRADKHSPSLVVPSHSASRQSKPVRRTAANLGRSTHAPKMPLRGNSPIAKFPPCWIRERAASTRGNGSRAGMRACPLQPRAPRLPSSRASLSTDQFAPRWRSALAQGGTRDRPSSSTAAPGAEGHPSRPHPCHRRRRCCQRRLSRQRCSGRRPRSSCSPSTQAPRHSWPRRQAPPAKARCRQSGRPSGTAWAARRAPSPRPAAGRRRRARCPRSRCPTPSTAPTARGAAARAPARRRQRCQDRRPGPRVPRRRAPRASGPPAWSWKSRRSCGQGLHQPRDGSSSAAQTRGAPASASSRRRS